MKTKLLILLTLACFSSAGSLKAQGLLKRIKEKAGSVAEKAVDKKADELINGKRASNEGASGAVGDQNYDDSGAAGSGSSSGSRRGKPANKGGAGLITTAPDVNENLTSAETAFKASEFGQARNALQQAMLGVEMEIGKNLLKSLPETVSGLPVQEEADKVSSTSYGWNGLTIYREYLKDDKQLSVTITNNSLLMSSYNAILAASGFAGASSDQKWKQITVKGLKGIAEYDEDTGYKVSIPLGQTSLMVWEGINFDNEQDLMAALNAFDIASVKKTLGEN